MRREPMKSVLSTFCTIATGFAVVLLIQQQSLAQQGRYPSFPQVSAPAEVVFSQPGEAHNASLYDPYVNARAFGAGTQQGRYAGLPQSGAPAEVVFSQPGEAHNASIHDPYVNARAFGAGTQQGRYAGLPQSGTRAESVFIQANQAHNASLNNPYANIRVFGAGNWRGGTIWTPTGNCGQRGRTTRPVNHRPTAAEIQSDSPAVLTGELVPVAGEASDETGQDLTTVSGDDSSQQVNRPNCQNTACQSSSRGCRPRTACCPSFWAHRSGVYGEYLYLTARDVNVAYGTPVDGLGANAVPIGPVAIADPDYEGGFRTGFSVACDECTSFTANYTVFESLTSDEVSLLGGSGFIRSNTVHPNTVNVAADSLAASATYDIDFEMADANFKGLIWGGCNHSLNYLLGFRYATLEQDFLGTYSINGTTTVETDIDFEGFGPRIGFEGERLVKGGFLVYAKGAANFLVGEFKSTFLQQNVFSPGAPQAVTGYEDDRVVSQLELELGLGWQNRCGNCRVTAGYYLVSWQNSLTTPDFINAVQADDFSSLSESIAFDGMTARAEWRF
jgi:hypothetical protein